MLVRLLLLLVLLPAALTGCVHRIEVSPIPSSQATRTIPLSLQVVVDAPLLEGADHRPGIVLFTWPHEDLEGAVTRYATRRGTFRSVSTDHAELRLHLATKLALSSRQGRYHYQIRLQAELHEQEHLVKSYLAEATAAGSLARWVTASDRDPIESALQSALDDLFNQIEADSSLHNADGAGASTPEVVQ